VSAPTTDPRQVSSARLARLGFTEPAAAQRLLADPVLAVPALARALEPAGERPGPLLAALADTPDPDRALLALVRLLAAADPATLAELHAALATGGPAVERRRLLAVLGTSIALGEHLVRHPVHWRAVLPGVEDADTPRTALLTAVGADPGAAVPVASSSTREAGRDALRRAYTRRLLSVVADDLTAPDPAAVLDVVTHRLADLADAALEAALALAREQVPGHEHVRLAVVALGKCGATELNYVSDVDVLYVVAPADGAAPAGQEEPDDGALTRVGTRLATALQLTCSATTAEGTLWPVDAALRPEGRDGPLVRTLESHLAYYQRWARTWEFQALLKARPAAGDAALGRAWADAVAPLVWAAAERPGMVSDTRAMRRRVEEHVPRAEADRQLKLGPGGLRDVEFSVQLLQLVHGRAEPALRMRNTLVALERLAAYGFVGRHDAAQLDADYRFLRVLEHRLQLHRLRRTHLLPTDPAELRWLARSAKVPGGAEGLAQVLAVVRRRVRRLHERLFYRPLLEAVAQLSTEQVRLSPAAARDRLEGLGYRDPAGALRHIAALASGVSRRAAIQRQLLPVLLTWFAQGADPDAGLLAFRRISERLGGTHWYLKMLRDEGAAAQRMAVATSTSRLVASGLERDAEATRWLGTDADLVPRTAEELARGVLAAVERQGDPGAEAELVRRLREREVLRTALADVVGLLTPGQVRRALTGSTDAVLCAALEVAQRRVAARWAQAGRGPLPTSVAVVGMGRLGGAEMGYGSDADVLFVHEPHQGAPAGAAQEAALAVAGELRKVVAAPGPGLPLEVDAALRPEGRDGPLARSLASYAEYYRRWALPWEAQALLRARPVAGDAGLGERFTALVDPVRYPAGGLDDAAVREVRRIKARVESERLPRGTDPHRHLKLGPGYLADVEWTAQLLQLRHAHRVPALRTASTLEALGAAEEAGLLGPGDRAALVEAWETAARARDALVLVRGRAGDVLPTDPREAGEVAHVLGLVPATAEALSDAVRRTGRHARAVVERVFYG
jgi:glutamate-ammonia-ligase adenylyltransferase